jgi:phosphatidylglycerophosphatase A
MNKPIEVTEVTAATEATEATEAADAAESSNDSSILKAHPTPADLVWKRPAHALSLGFGSGLFPAAPGTIATLWAWVVFLMIDPFVSDWAWALIFVAGLVLGAKACTITGLALGKTDSSNIVWDEILAFWLVLWCLPRLSDPAGFHTLGIMPEWLLQCLAFGLFRFFDIAKPAPIRMVDRRTRNGWGVMLDDLIAAGYTLLVCAVVLRLVHYLEPWLI